MADVLKLEEIQMVMQLQMVRAVTGKSNVPEQITDLRGSLSFESIVQFKTRIK